MVSIAAAAAKSKEEKEQTQFKAYLAEAKVRDYNSKLVELSVAEAKAYQLAVFQAAEAETKSLQARGPRGIGDCRRYSSSESQS